MTDTEASSATIDDASAIGYADALEELEDILDELEDPSIDIDALSARVERAAELIKVCRGRINAAQEKVTGIVAELEEFTASESD